MNRIKKFLVSFANEFRKVELVLEKHPTLFLISVAIVWFIAGLLIGTKYFCVCECLTSSGFNKMREAYCNITSDWGGILP